MSFSKAPKILFNETPLCSPAPGAYNPKTEPGVRGALSFEKTERFSNTKFVTPGPSSVTKVYNASRRASTQSSRTHHSSRDSLCSSNGSPKSLKSNAISQHHALNTDQNPAELGTTRSCTQVLFRKFSRRNVDGTFRPTAVRDSSSCESNCGEVVAHVRSPVQVSSPRRNSYNDAAIQAKLKRFLVEIQELRSNNGELISEVKGMQDTVQFVLPKLQEFFSTLKTSHDTLTDTLSKQSVQLVSYENENTILRSKSESMEAQLQNMQQENETIILTMQQRDELIKEQTEQIWQLQGTIASLEQDLHCEKALRIEVAEELQQCRNLMCQLSRDKNHLEQVLQQAKQNNVNLEATIAKLHESLHLSETNSKSVESDLKYYKSEAEKLHIEIAQMSSSYSELKTSKESLACDFERLSQNLDETRSLCKDLDATVAKLTEEQEEAAGKYSEFQAKLEEEKTALYKEFDDQKTAFETASTEVDMLQSCIQSLEETIVSLKSEKTNISEHVLQLESEISALQEKLKEAELGNVEQQMACNFLTLNLGALEQKVHEMETEKNELLKTKEELQSAIKATREELSKRNCEAEVAREETQQAEDRVQEMLKLKEMVCCELVKLKSEYEEAKRNWQTAELTSREEVITLKDSFAMLEAEMGQLAMNNDQLKTQLESSTVENKALSTEIQELQQRVEHKDSYFKKLVAVYEENKVALGNTQDENINLKRAFEEGQTELRRVKKLTEKLQHQISALETELCVLKDCKKELQALKEKHEKERENWSFANMNLEGELKLTRCQLREETERCFTMMGELSELREPMQKLQRQNEQLEKNKREAQENCTELSIQMAQLAGHKNPKQKIHYVKQLAEKKDHLAKEMTKLQLENNTLKSTVAKLKAELSAKSRFSTKKLPLPGKENEVPSNANSPLAKNGRRDSLAIRSPRI